MVNDHTNSTMDNQCPTKQQTFNNTTRQLEPIWGKGVPRGVGKRGGGEGKGRGVWERGG